MPTRSGDGAAPGGGGRFGRSARLATVSVAGGYPRRESAWRILAPGGGCREGGGGRCVKPELEAGLSEFVGGGRDGTRISTRRRAAWYSVYSDTSESVNSVGKGSLAKAQI